MMKDLKELYLDVFEDDLTTVKLCGRDACKKLIRAMSASYPGVNFGSSDGGWMEINNVREYGQKLFE